MESIGKKLQETREKANYSLEQVARDTHISKNYLVALEEEDFTSLPGEPYVYGFLRNYAEYLSLNPDELVNLYKNMRMQEQPLPMNELLETHRRRSPASWALLGVLAVVVLGGVGFLLYRLIGGSAAAPEPAVEESETAISAGKGEPGEYRFEEEGLAQWFNRGDIIHLPLQGQVYDLQVLEARESLSLATPSGPVEMRIGEERALDVNADLQPDVRLVLNDLDRGASRANLGLYKITRPAAAPGGEPPAVGAVSPVAAVAGEAAAPALQIGLQGGQAISVLQASEPAAFRVNMSFRGYCLFRYLMDDDNREERLFHKGESFALDVRRNVKMWISNAGALQLMVAGRNVEVGKPGEVSAWLIRWKQDGVAGRYTLEMVPID